MSRSLIGFSQDVNGFAKWGERALEMVRNLSKASNTPHSTRVLRSFSSQEALEISGGSEWQWKEWLREHPEIREAAKSEGRIRVPLEVVHQFMGDRGLMPVRLPGTRGKVFTVGALKGGSGKTMTSCHLGVGMALRGWKVLIVDADFQGTATRMMNFDPAEIAFEDTLAAVYPALSQFQTGSTDWLPELRPVATHVAGLDLIPASDTMAAQDFEVAAAFLDPQNAKKNLPFWDLVRMALEPLRDVYDVILIDTPPSFSFGALNLLWAADGLIMPVPPSMPDFSAAGAFSSLVGEYMRVIGGSAGRQKVWQSVMVVLTRVDNTASSRLVREFSDTVFQKHAITQQIPHSSAVLTAAAVLRTIYELVPGKGKDGDIDAKTLARAKTAFEDLRHAFETNLQAMWAADLVEEQA